MVLDMGVDAAMLRGKLVGTAGTFVADNAGPGTWYAGFEDRYQRVTMYK